LNANRRWRKWERFWFWFTGVTPADSLARRPRPRLCEKCGGTDAVCECDGDGELSEKDRYGLDFQGMER